MNFLTSLRKELLEAWRGKRLLVAVILLGAFGMMSPLLAKFMREIFSAVPGAEVFAGIIPEPTLMDAIGQYVKNIEQFGILLALLLAMGLVATEKERGTAALMLSKPLSRTAFLLAKFAGLGLVLLAALLVAALGGYYYTLFLFGPLPVGGWLLLNAMVWLLMLVVAAITLLFSTLFASQAAAAGVALGAYLLVSLFGNVPALSPYIPDRVVAWGVSLFTTQPEPRWGALGVILALIGLCLTAACLVFRKQEL